MKIFNRIALVLTLASAAAFGQTALTQTTLSSAVLATDKVINLTLATGVSAPTSSAPGTQLYVIAPGAIRGELMITQSVNSTAITVARGRSGVQSAFPNGSRVLIGAANLFSNYDPSGGCTASATIATPLVNTKTGLMWICSSVTSSWVPGFGNMTAPLQPTTSVAAAAGVILPTGPMFHVTGSALAVTGFTVPVGFPLGGTISVVPDVAFTWTAAGNFASTGTAVIGKTLVFTYDFNSGKFSTSY